MRALVPIVAAVALAAGCGPHGPPAVEAVTIVSSTLPPGRVGEPYETTLLARGGNPPYVFLGGYAAVPPGLSLRANGTLVGTPTEAGDYALDVVARDTDGRDARGWVRVEIASVEEPTPPLRLATASLPIAEVGEPYDAALLADGGSPPYAWTLVSGQLPDGLSLDGEAGRIVGSPTSTGIEELRLQVRDADGEQRERDLELRVSSAPQLRTEVFPIGVVGQPYEAQLQVSGGAWPLHFEVYSGRLPDGLSLHASGFVSGTPTTVESRPVRFRVTDGAGVVRDRRIRIWIVEDQPTEVFASEPIPASCGLEEPTVVSATLRVEDPTMIARVQFAVDVAYGNIGMLAIDVVAPDGTRVRLHEGGGRVGGGLDLHYMFETDAIAWGSLLPLIGLGPRGPWTLEVRVLPDPGYGCVPEPGSLQRFAVVIGPVGPATVYLRTRGVTPNNLIDGAFARVSGGGLAQDVFDLYVERWSSGDNEIPEGGTGDDVLLEIAPVQWSSDLPAEVGTISAEGHFQAGAETGAGTLTGRLDELTLEYPIKVVAPDWVP